MKDCLVIGGINDFSGMNNTNSFIKQHFQTNLTGFFYPYVVYETLNIISYLKTQDISCTYILSLEAEKQKAEEILKEGIQVVTILTAQINKIYDYVKIVKFIRQHSNCKIVIGGSFFKNVINKLNLQEQTRILNYIKADFYINRYESMAELSKYICMIKSCNISLEQIPNAIYFKDQVIHYNKANMSFTFTESYPLLWDELKDNDIGRTAGLRTTINCDFHCAFCAIKDDAERFEVISLQSIERDLLSLSQKGAVKSIFFTDETINYPKERFIKMLEMIKYHNFNFNWYAFYRGQFVDDDVANLAYESGCIAAIMGIESGNNQMLQEMNKNVTTQQLKKGLDALKKAGIFTFALFVVGFPGENELSIQDTINFINEAKPMFYVLNPWTCEMGTKVWDDREKYGLTYNNGHWKHDTMEYNQVETIIDEMNMRIYSSKNVRGVDFSYLIQLYNEGYSVEQLYNVIDKFKKVNSNAP